MIVFLNSSQISLSNPKSDSVQVPSGEKGCGRKEKKTVSKVPGAAEGCLHPVAVGAQLVQIYSWKRNREEGEENLQ